jgi:hypothetical protein
VLKYSIAISIELNFTLNCGETNHDSEKPQTPTVRSCTTAENLNQCLLKIFFMMR